MSESEARRLFRAIEQARKLGPTGYVTLPASVLIALDELFERLDKELEEP